MQLPSAGNLLSVPRNGDLRCKFLALWHCYFSPKRGFIHQSVEWNYKITRKIFDHLNENGFVESGRGAKHNTFIQIVFDHFLRKTICAFFWRTSHWKKFLFCPFKIFFYPVFSFFESTLTCPSMRKNFKSTTGWDWTLELSVMRQPFLPLYSCQLWLLQRTNQMPKIIRELTPWQPLRDCYYKACCWNPLGSI